MPRKKSTLGRKTRNATRAAKARAQVAADIEEPDPSEGNGDELPDIEEPDPGEDNMDELPDIDEPDPGEGTSSGSVRIDRSKGLKRLTNAQRMKQLRANTARKNQQATDKKRKQCRESMQNMRRG